jgi:dATP pyrophosphohydrolase
MKASHAEFAIFRRADSGAWQGIAGGGEDHETALEAARRESTEEAGFPSGLEFVQLSTTSSIPVTSFPESTAWGDQVFIVPEHSFGLDAQEYRIHLSSEHMESVWVDYDDAIRLLTYDGNKTALWELNQRIHGLGPREPVP